MCVCACVRACVRACVCVCVCVFWYFLECSCELLTNGRLAKKNDKILDELTNI